MAFSQPKISIIIPFYNSELYLSECIESVLNQTLNDIEIICIDDGSTDQSLHILNEYSKKDLRIIVVSQSNKGAGIARNKGLDIAKGEFIMFLDSDDWYPNNTSLYILYDKAIKNQVHICGGSFSEFKNGKFNKDYSGIYQLYTFKKEELKYYKDFQFDYGYIRFIYNLDFLKKNHIKFPDYKRFQDPPFYVKAMVLAEKFYTIPKVVYCYRRGQNKVTWTSEKINDVVKGITDNLKISSKYGLSKLHRISVERLNVEYYPFIMKNINRTNFKLIELLVDANKNINHELLISDENTIFNEKNYILKALDKIIFSDKTVIVKSKELEDILNSRSYKLGRAITWLPRKIRFILFKI